MLPPDWQDICDYISIPNSHPNIVNTDAQGMLARYWVSETGKPLLVDAGQCAQTPQYPFEANDLKTPYRRYRWASITVRKTSLGAIFDLHRASPQTLAQLCTTLAAVAKALRPNHITLIFFWSGAWVFESYKSAKECISRIDEVAHWQAIHLANPMMGIPLSKEELPTLEWHEKILHHSSAQIT
ncbi:MAG: hypothetical protein AAF352_02335, partial [Pseudomonadota bacterium]